MDPTDSSNNDSYTNAWGTTAGEYQVYSESSSMDTASSFSDTTYSTSSLFGD